MKIEGIDRNDLHRFVIERSIATTIHEFKRTGGFLDPVDHDEFYAVAEITAKMTCSGCPVQYEGVVNGKNFYYRDRHGLWSFEVYENELFDSKMLYSKEGASKGDIGYRGFLFAEKIIYKQSLKFARKFRDFMPKRDEEKS